MGIIYNNTFKSQEEQNEEPIILENRLLLYEKYEIEIKVDINTIENEITKNATEIIEN